MKIAADLPLKKRRVRVPLPRDSECQLCTRLHTKYVSAVEFLWIVPGKRTDMEQLPFWCSIKPEKSEQSQVRAALGSM